ncbi:MAG: ferrous iron transport protein B [Clostridia bacterium]|nr:ferrous iron transport protein B [Clostridia bacterium]
MGISIALAGNPNVGKTTLFNELTGSNQFVGNWPGVTVEKKEGVLKGHDDVKIVDLPGVYSLSPYTTEEIVARKYLVNEKPDAILDIVDGTNLERNLYLTTQLLELGIPVVIAINMMDTVRKNGDKIDIELLSKRLSCPVIEISALKGEGCMDAADHAIAASHDNKLVAHHNFSGEVEHALAHIEEACIHDMPLEQQRWYAVKIFERDKEVIKDLSIKGEILKHIEADIRLVEETADDDAESIITNERYLYIERLVEGCYERRLIKRLSQSDKIDRIVTNRYLALPIFALVMFLVYFISVSSLGAWLTNWVNDSIFGNGWSLFGLEIPSIPDAVSSLMVAGGFAPWVIGLVVDGVIAGLGAILGFLPQMLLLFLMLSFLESCGYMSRIAFILDKIFRKFGLSGKSFIPILVGTGCGVPGIMASRTIENINDRRMTIITTTFIPCGAKLPFIALISGALFGGAWWVAPSAYFMGICAIIISGVILKKTRMFKGEETPFVMELPPYHMPTLKNLLRSMWDRGWSFVKKAGSVVIGASIIIWFASNFGWDENGFGMVSMDNSLLAIIGSAIAFIFIPLGFGIWQAAVSTISGLLAKEGIVSTLAVLYAGASIGNSGDFWTNIAGAFTPLEAYSFLAFNLLCAPCVAACSAIRAEMNSGKWSAFAIGYQCLFAYLVSFIIYQVGSFVTGGGSVIGVTIALIIIAFALYMIFRKNKNYEEKL